MRSRAPVSACTGARIALTERSRGLARARAVATAVAVSPLAMTVTDAPSHTTARPATARNRGEVDRPWCGPRRRGCEAGVPARSIAPPCRPVTTGPRSRLRCDGRSGRRPLS